MFTPIIENPLHVITSLPMWSQSGQSRPAQLYLSVSPAGHLLTRWPETDKIHHRKKTDFKERMPAKITFGDFPPL